MIQRYIHPKAAYIWTEQNKFQKWLEVELAVCDALAELGEIPQVSAKNIRKKAHVNLDRIIELEAVTKHEVVAFVNSVL
jgi:adenylosuccinate lyase